MALQNLRSSTPSKRPDASSMSDGQIALNTAAASAGLFFKDSNGDLVKTGPVHIGTTAPNSTPATGGSTGNSKGEAWLDTSNSNYVLKIYDGTAFRAVEMAAGSARQLLQTNAAGTDVEFTSNVDVPGTLDVTGATTLDSTASVAGLLSANGKISFAEGNASAPGIHPGSDTDTGISSPSLNELSFSTAGTSRLYIDSTGKIGVGVNSPDYALDVRSGDGRFKRSASNAAAIYLGSTSNNYIFGDSDANVLAFGTNGSEKVRITSTGNFGVGTSSPSDKLSVVSTTGTVGASITAAGNASLVLDSGVGGTSGDQLSFIDFKNNGTVKARISVNEGVAGQPLEINSTTSNNVFVATGGGNVGIGSASANAKLTVTDPSGTGNVNLADLTASTAGANQLIRMIGRNAADSGVTSVDFFKTYQSGFGIHNNDTDSSNFTRFIVGASERMRITSSGNVGIGTAVPGTYDSTSNTLVVGEAGTGDRGITIASGTSHRGTVMFADGNSGLGEYAGYLQYNHNGDYLAIATNNSERMRINSSGNIGIGTSSPSMLLDVQGTSNPQLKVSATSTGTNSAGLYIENQGQRNWQIWADRPSDQLRIGHNSRASTVVSVTDSRVGIGNTNPTSPLHVVGDIKTEGTFIALPFSGSSEGGEIQIKNPDATTNGAIIDISAANTFRIFQLNNNSLMQLGQLSGTGGTVTLHTSGNERFRVDSVGNCGIGTSAPITDLTVRGIASGTEGGNLCIQNTGSGLNTSVALYLTPNNGGGNDLQRTAAIKSRQDVAGNYANLEFYTSQSNTPTERARFDSAGRFMIGKTTWGWTSPGFQTEANNGQAVTITNDGSFSVKHCLGLRRDNSDGSVAVFYRGGVQVGSINVTGTNSSFVNSSDYRLKENIIDIDGAINRVKQLAPKRFNFIADADTTVDGFLAHEAQTVVPEAVTGSKDEVDDDGNPVMQGIDQSKLVPLLTAALKEAIAKIETLETKVAALEAE